MRSGSIRKQFAAAVTVTLLIVAAASALTVWGCLRFRQWLVPDTNDVMLRVGRLRAGEWENVRSMRLEVDGPWEGINVLRGVTGAAPDDEMYGTDGVIWVSVSGVEYGIGRNGPRRKAAYIAAGAAMGILPAAYAVAGTFLCGLWFYRKKLSPAISVLDEAAGHISRQDLDFTVECPVDNELGGLCGSFEKMRKALYDNNLTLWRALEERRNTVACVAHDLRNPLAIMEGTVENTRALARAGELTGEKLEQSLDNLAATAKRMERYTDYVRDIDAVEERRLNMTRTRLPIFLRDAADSVRIMAADSLSLGVAFDVPECTAELDAEIFYRVLENVFSNAVRYAVSGIDIEFSLLRDTLRVRVLDDGPGFSAAMLGRRNSLYYTEDPAGGHMGLGLAESRILCEKHGGGLSLSNRPEAGAQVEFTLAVKRL